MNEDRMMFSRNVEWFLITLVLLNVIFITLSTVKTFAAEYGVFFSYFEQFSVVVFVIEYLARLARAKKLPQFSGRAGILKYALSAYAIIDLLAIAPYFFALIYGFDSNSSFLRIVRILTIFRLAKLLRYSQALDLIYDVLRAKRRELAVCGLLIAIFVFLSASLLYILENAAQPTVFSSIPASIWWAVISVTTIGYGDIVPVTTGGKIVSGLLAFAGVGLIAIPTSIIAGGFIEATTNRPKSNISGKNS
jgi:voltage-gated potassium channel